MCSKGQKILLINKGKLNEKIFSTLNVKLNGCNQSIL